MEKYLAPPGPAEEYSSTDELFHWLNCNFERYGDIYRASVYGSDVYVISAPEYCEHVLRRNLQNYLRKGLVVQRIALALGSNLITSNGELWENQRRMIQPAFTKRAICRLSGMIAAVNAELLRKWREAAMLDATVNVTQDVSRMVLQITLRSIFGDDYEAVAPKFESLAAEATRDFRFAEILGPLRKLVLDLRAQRRHKGGTYADTLGVLMEARDREHGKPMPEAQLAREIINLVVAGHETTASLLNWMWYLIATHPEVQSRLGAEFDRLPWEGVPSIESFAMYTYTLKVIDECLRLYPPLWLMSRKALHDDRIGEYFVPAGAEIFISPYLIQHSPQLWETPERFNPDRQSTEHSPDRPELAMCPFGAGPRKCIGDFFARVEIQMHLMMFGKELWLRRGETSPPEIMTGINLLSKYDLYMLPAIRV
jgi:cytochrome P450